MKNKVELKKYLKITLFISICLLIFLLIINIYEYNVYTSNFNEKINQIIGVLNEKYPLLTETEIIEILNNDNVRCSNILNKYGIDIQKQSVLEKNDKDFFIFIVLDLLFMSFSIIILILLFLKYNKKKEKDINDITNYIEQINKKNYELSIDSISEDELSILKNEIYKTTVILKESAENSNLDKLNLKKSLEDISHQLKTPLTSILIMLDNLIDNPDIDINTKEYFIKDIKREVININFLVQAILKLSKFDSNTIHFNKEYINLGDVLSGAVKNVSTLCDLRNITINIKEKENVIIYCDYKWQVEAITNILKNCIEHSKNGQTIELSFSKNNVYSLLEIKDFGTGISKKDLPHIFERFYKGENSNAESIGIGLALTKTIIEEDNGTINVDSSENGTVFKIKYFGN